LTYENKLVKAGESLLFLFAKIMNSERKLENEKLKQS